MSKNQTTEEVLTPLQQARKDANRQFYRAGNAMRNALIKAGAPRYVKGKASR